VAVSEPATVTIGRGTRLRIGAQVVLSAIFAAAAAALLVWIAERPGLRVRADLTQARENTLDPASRAVIERLGEDVDIDVFFTPMGDFLGPVAYDVQERTLRLLVLLRDAAGGRIEVHEHELSTAQGKAAAMARMQELALREVEPGGVVVVSLGPRRSVLRLRGDLADVDPGDPRGEFGPPRPARVLLFRGEEAIVSALLEVGQGETIRALFSSGHGELALEGGLSELRVGLERSGYEVDRWEGERSGKIPDDCAVLAIIGPEQPFTPDEALAIVDFVESGGRLVTAPGHKPVQGEGGLAALLTPLGIRIVTEGVVAAPRATITGQPLFGIPECAVVRVWSGGMAGTSPVTEALRRADRYVDMPFSRALQRAPAPVGGSVITILTTGDETWRDLESPGAGHDWKKSPDEERGPFALGMTSIFPPSRPARKAPDGLRGGADVAVPECRVVCLGSADAFSNPTFEVDGDLVLAAFDWSASRDFRVQVTPRSKLSRRIAVSEGTTLSRVHLVAVLLLPGLCFALGFLTAWRRRRP
jgi:hypothetical protein